ncbi:MAG: anti-sigma factor [Proteobacteria bacterium]|nr:anti-sigma factor [Pseudomonadota bacterium]
MIKPGTISTDPPDIRLLLHALADGELDAATALALERRLASDPALAAEYARIVALRTSFQTMPLQQPSPQLLARIEDLAQARTPAATPVRRKEQSFDWRALAASILVTAFLASSATYWATQGPAPQGFASEIAGSHRRSLLASSAVDVASSDRHTVKPWLDARIGVSPPAVDLSADGYALVGGRVEVIDGKPVPALVYQLRKHLITLVAIPQDQAMPRPGAPDLSAGGFPIVQWSDGTFSYWAVSDIGRDELQQFADRFRAATTPAAAPK